MSDETRRKLLTIVTEGAIENLVVRDIDRLGAHGYTITEARGRGSRGVRSSSWDASSNIRIEVVCDGACAERISSHLRATYYQNYAMIVFISDVTVLRPEKF